MSRFPLLCLIPFGLIACSPSEPEPKLESNYRGAGSVDGDLATFEIPTLTPLDNGNIVVRFQKSGCSVLFDRDGKLLEGGKLCDDVHLHRARKAVKAHIAEREADFLDV